MLSGGQPSPSLVHQTSVCTPYYRSHFLEAVLVPTQPFFVRRGNFRQPFWKVDFQGRILHALFRKRDVSSAAAFPSAAREATASCRWSLRNQDGSPLLSAFWLFGTSTTCPFRFAFFQPGLSSTTLAGALANATSHVALFRACSAPDAATVPDGSFLFLQGF